MKLLYTYFLILIISFHLYPQGYICAIGGGSENYNSWSDEPYRWIVQKSDSGKIIVLSVNSETNWIPDYFISFGASQAVNLRINSRSIADQQSIYDQLITARAIFIKGGDQWNYINYWKGTKTEEGIKYVFNNGGVVAGTSAGLAVLGDIDYTARYGSAVSKESFLNPFGSIIDYEDNFLNFVPDVLFDSHFIERGRFGRLIAMVFKFHFTSGRNIMGVGVDDRTAVCIEPDGIGTVMGSAAVTIFQKDSLTTYSRNGNSYTINGMKCDQLTKGWKYDFSNRRIHYIPPTAKTMDPARNWEYPATNIWLSGQNNIQNQTGSALTNFLSSVNTQKIGVIYNQGYQASVSTLTAFLTSGGYSFFTLPLNSASLNLQSSADSILTATSFILLGDSLNVISGLNDITKPAGNSFIQKAVNEKTPVYFIGNTGKTAGGNYVDRVEVNTYMSYRGLMTNNQGIGLFRDMIFQPLLFDDADYYENRTSALLWGMMVNRKRIGLYLDNSDYLRISSAGRSITSAGPMPVMVVDARNTTYVDSSTYIAGAGYKARQVVAMNELRYFISNISRTYSLDSNSILTGMKGEESGEDEKKSYIRSQNYPNPFKEATTIHYRLSEPGEVKISIYNINGESVKELRAGFLMPGIHQVTWDGRNESGDNLSSGVYAYLIHTPALIDSGKFLIVR